MKKPSDRELYKKIGCQIKFYRNSEKLTQTALGRRLGVTRVAVEKMENTGIGVTIEHLLKLSRIFQCKLEHLMPPITEWPLPLID